MFSQFRQAVEILSPQPRRGSQDSSQDDQQEYRVRSLDVQGGPRPQSSQLSSTQLAESAISNLRKSLATQRSGSPGPASLPKSNSLPDTNLKAPKSNLEERLRRATFAIGEASNATTPGASARQSPSPLSPAKNHPFSPSSTPLPDSPPLPSRLEAPDPTVVILPPLLLPPVVDAAGSPHGSENIAQIHPEADIPLPPQSPTEDIPQDIVSPDTDHAPETIPVGVEALQEQLILIEQRFSDVSSSYKRLQSEKAAADIVIRELTPLDSTQDAKGLRDYLHSIIQETEGSQDEIKRLRGKLTRQDERIEELRDTHRLESTSQSDQIHNLRRQLQEAEALLNASLKSQTQIEENNVKRKADTDQLKLEVERAKGQAKDEEEKRVKAISLLKTVRQKLVKAEKDKEDALKDMNLFRDRDRSDREKEQTEKANLQREIDAVNTEREKAVVGLKVKFDRELIGFKERSEQELQALRGQFELEAVTSKGAYVKELAAKNTRISALESSTNTLSRDKNAFFDQLQLRQAELESSQYHLESLQSQNTELQYQLREINDRLAMTNEELSDARREQDAKSSGPATSAEDVARLLSTAQAKYESRIGDLKKNLDTMERERNEGEAEWSRKVREKARETDDLKRALDISAKTWEQRETSINELKEENGRLREEVGLYQAEASSLQVLSNKVKDVESAGKSQSLDFEAKVASLEQLIEESKNREAQLRVHNKTLREELRKVQTSAALLERQRNPGVGYWTSRPENFSPEIRTSMSSTSSDIPSPTGSPGPTPPVTAKTDEALNLEYLRNVILQFLEHKEMRPNLVRVLSIILHFTPQETRRLIAKA